MRPVWNTLFLGLGCCLAAAGCHGAGPRPAGDTLSASARVLPVPFTAQASPYLCGLAAVDMLTRYYQRPLDARQVDRLRQAAQAQHGLSGDALKAALQAAGYFVAVYPSSLEPGPTGLYSLLDQGRPLLVMLGSGLRHVVVVVGYDKATDEVVVQDPARGTLKVPIPDFVAAWKAAHYFTLLATPS